MSVTPATAGPIFASDETYLTSEVTPACYASPGLHCKLDLTKCSLDTIEPSPISTTTIENIDDLEKVARSQPHVKGKTQEKREIIQLATLFWFLYLEGWNDGSNGPLLPRLQKVYGVGYATVSLIFVFACMGFITGSVSNVILSQRLGFGKTIVLGSLFQVLAYCIESSAPPFPAFVFAYFINGIGLALQNANAVGYVACIKQNPELKMGLLMAAYGAGALSSPLVATQFSQLPLWNLYYLTSLGISITNSIALIVVFRLKQQSECLAEIGVVDADHTSTSEHSHLRQIMSNKDVHLLAAFALFYVGAEVAIGGWAVTYMIDARGGGPSSGYVSTGFFGGLMVGRLALLQVNERVGERLAMFIYAAFAIILELIVWLVPSLVGDAVAVAIIGVLLGPMYLILTNQARRVLPRWLLTGAIGWIAGVGQAGSALIPFMAGAIAQHYGIKSLQPVLVGILVLMTALWALVFYNSRHPES